MYPQKAFSRKPFLLIAIWLATFASCNRLKNNSPETKPDDIAKYNALMKKADDLTADYKFDSAYSALLKIHEWALKTNDSLLIARSLTQLGNINRSDVKMIIAEKHLDEAIAILRRHNKPELLAEALEYAGSVKQSQADYQASQQLLFESLEIAEANKDHERACRLLNLIGSNFDITENKRQAISYFRQGLNLAEKYRFKKAKYSIFINLGVAYRRMQPDSAKYYYQKVVQATSLPANDRIRLQAELNLGNIYFDEGNYHKALLSYEHLYDFSLRQKFPEGIAMSINGIAAVYAIQGKTMEAIKLLNGAIRYFEKTGNMSIVVEFKQNIIEEYRKLGDYKEIDKIYSNIMLLKDSLMNVNKQTNIQNLEFFYQNQKKELQNKQLATELRFARLSNIFWLVIFLIVTCCSVGMGVYYRKNLKQKYRSLQELEERIRLQQKLHDTKSQHTEKLEKQIEKKQKELSTLGQQLQLLQDEIVSSRNNNSLENKPAYPIGYTAQGNRKNYWENLTMKFNIIYPGFSEKLMSSYPYLNTNDVQFCLLIKLNLPLKDIANILNISQYSLYKRKYRLSEKMGLQGKDKDLYSLIQNLQ